MNAVASRAPVLEHRAMDVVTIDCRYMDMPRYAAAYLLIDGGRAAFIDNNTVHAVPRMLEALKSRGLSESDVEYVIITHVHLDHAGGTSALMKACPDATLLAHPRAARHVIDPSKLVASASAVYGEARFEELYGKIEPVAEGRVQIREDEQTARLGSTTLRFLHTRGHANHHFCIHADDAVFSGDAFGLCYPDLQAGGLYVFPSTSPTDFDGPEAKKSVERVVATGARRVFPTHFGEVTELEGAREQMLDHLTFCEGVVEDAVASDLVTEDLTKFCTDRWKQRLVDTLPAEVNRPESWKLLQTDLDLNGQGLAWAAHKIRKKRAS
jgi:glyoxylase-like metal-dependent hydrolase (beta-lactamase superfamily II)